MAPRTLLARFLTLAAPVARRASYLVLVAHSPGLLALFPAPDTVVCFHLVFPVVAA